MEVQETVHQKDMLHQEIQVQAMHLPLHLIDIVECAGPDAVGKAAADIIMEKLYNGDNEQ